MDIVGTGALAEPRAGSQLNRKDMRSFVYSFVETDEDHATYE